MVFRHETKPQCPQLVYQRRERWHYRRPHHHENLRRHPLPRIERFQTNHRQRTPSRPIGKCWSSPSQPQFMFDFYKTYLQDWFKANGKDVSLEFLDASDQSLIAIQGPKTVGILQPYMNIELENLHFMTSVTANIGGIENCRITRCGYTGEDGVEISIPSEHVQDVVNMLLQNEFVKLAGLGARDTLR